MPKTLTKRNDYTNEQMTLIKSLIAKDATDDELALFIYQAKRTGLDPLSRQIYFIKYKGKASIQTSIDGFRAIAGRTGEHAGTDDAVFKEENNKPLSASVTVYRMVQGQRCAYSATARWSEYNQSFNSLWQKMPYTMLGKCAEALALRKAFPSDLSGLYTQDEMIQTESENKEEEKLAKDTIIEATVIKTEQQSSPEEDQKRRIALLVKQLGWEPKTKEDWPKLIKDLTSFDLEPANYEAIIKRLELYANK